MQNTEVGDIIMKKKLIKIILLTITFILIIGNLNYIVKADDEVFGPPAPVQTNPTINPDYWEPNKVEDEPELNEKVGNILGVINIIGILSSVGTLMLMGIKYMLGSIEEKASYKKAMLPWLVGAIILFSATTIPNMLYSFIYGTPLVSRGSSGTQPGSTERPSKDVTIEAID